MKRKLQMKSMMPIRIGVTLVAAATAVALGASPAASEEEPAKTGPEACVNACYEVEETCYEPCIEAEDGEACAAKCLEASQTCMESCGES